MFGGSRAEQRLIPQSMASVQRKAPEQCCDLLAVQEAGFRGRGTFDRNGHNLLTDFQHLRNLARDVGKERSQSRQPLIAGRGPTHSLQEALPDGKAYFECKLTRFRASSESLPTTRPWFPASPAEPR